MRSLDDLPLGINAGFDSYFDTGVVRSQLRPDISLHCKISRYRRIFPEGIAVRFGRRHSGVIESNTFTLTMDGAAV